MPATPVRTYRCLAVVAAALAAAFAAQWYYTTCYVPPEPSPTGDMVAYELIENALRTGRTADLRDSAAKAMPLIEDGEFRQLCDFMLRNASLAVEMDIQTHQEGNSFTGFLKGALLGLRKPSRSLDSLGLMLEAMSTDYSAMGDRIDQRVAAQRQAYEVALAHRQDRLAWSPYVFWITAVAVGLAGGAWVYRDALFGPGPAVAPSRTLTSIR